MNLPVANNVANSAVGPSLMVGPAQRYSRCTPVPERSSDEGERRH